MSSIAKRYARALFEVAKERGLIDQMETELNDIVSVVNQSEDLNKILMHPHISADSKKQLFKDLFAAHVTAEVMNLLDVLFDSGRETELAAIVAAFIQQANEERGIADAVVTVAKPISEEEQARISEQFGKLVHKKLRIQTVIDPSILGGVVVKIGDRLYDGSIKSKLEHFAHQL
ncbi:F0F1 ATP synthase subunit delta [Brevibacillus fulvus]|uniref:ATP synthase subunit delta n=1 Tax=Brevibacillus fulvus TaxID=1125967 RepID=A0A938XTH9_9BACL|nr:F0F1 ATP synthase subunit delta [Brevibacillus fulvus]MBM7590183.1 F-type H+-transporting ATPase subunit delta [Brevibacillus fulvus]